MKNIFQFIKTSLIFSIAVFCFWAEFSQAKKVCPVNNSSQPQVCFFALNGPEESEFIKAQKGGFITIREGLCSYCLNHKGKMSSCEVRGTLVREFYSCPSKDEKGGGNVSRAFEEMTKQRCDGLVISGHHLGYYTGGKTKQDDNRKAGSETLDLKFLEELSCAKEGSEYDCRKWFSNIKYMHLHGSYTAGRDIESGNFDQAVLGKMKEYSNSNWTVKSANYFNREYASTVSQQNPLQSRYLRMFPKSLVFGWSAQAETIKQGSAQQIIDHMKKLGSFLKEEPDQLKSFLSWLGDTNEQSIIDDICDLWDGSNSNEVFRYDENNKKLKESEIGCQLSEAIRNKNKEKIKEPLENILQDCKRRNSSCRLLKQNINRIFAINSDYPEVLNSMGKKQKNTLLKGLNFILDDKNSGFVNKANALYLYKQLGSYENLKEREREFFEDIDSFYSTLEPSKESRVYKEMLAELIWKNNLGQTLEKENKYLVTGLIEKFEEDGFRDQALLIEAATLSDQLLSADQLVEGDKKNNPDRSNLMGRWLGLQIQNQRHKNLGLSEDLSLDNYERLSYRIIQSGVSVCHESNPFNDSIRPKESPEKAAIFDQMKESYDLTLDSYIEKGHC